MGVPVILRGMPVLRLLIPFCLGIIVQYHTGLPPLVTLPAVALSFILAASINLSVLAGCHRRSWYGGCALVFFMFCFSVSLSGIKTQSRTFMDLPYGEGAIIARVAGTPDERDSYWRVLIEPIGFISQGEMSRTKGRAIAWFEKDSLAGAPGSGDMVILPNRFVALRNYGNPFEFDYSRYMFHKGFRGVTWVREGNWFVTGEGGAPGLRIRAGRLRERLLDVLHDSGVKDKEYAVAAALILGYREGLDRELRETFAASGAMHILAVSGLHVGIIYMVLAWLLRFMTKTRIFRFIRPLIIIFVIWLYALITGLSPSVTRSATMFSFVAAGASIGRNSAIFNTLASSALFQLLVNPGLLFLAGFQLSYAAVAGIVLFQPVFYSLGRLRNWFADKVWALLTVSLSAQLTIFPLIIYHFNSFPNLFLVTNLFAVPLAVVILYSGLAFMALSFMPPVASLFAVILNCLLSLLNFITVSVGSLPFAQTGNIPVTLTTVIILYGILITGSCFFIYRRPALLLLALALVVGGLALRAANNFSRSQQKVFIVYNDSRNSLYGFVSGREKILVTTRDENMEYRELPVAAAATLPGLGISTYSMALNEKFFSLNGSFEHHTPQVNGSFVYFAGRRIFFARNSEVEKARLSAPAEIDVLVLSSGFTGCLDYMLDIVKPSIVVVDSSNSYFRREQAAGLCRSKGLPFIDVAVSGAYILSAGKGGL